MPDVDSIARVAHEVIRAYSTAIGEDPPPAWEEAPQWQHDTMCNGVRFLLVDPAATPEDTHNSWMAQKLAEGWVYGTVKDVELKRHPCIMPYQSLPDYQRIKDHLFSAVVRAMG